MKNGVTSLFAFAVGAFLCARYPGNLSEGSLAVVKLVLDSLLIVGLAVGFVLLSRQNKKLKEVLLENGIPEEKWK